MTLEIAKHKSVLLHEVLQYLEPQRGGLYLDGTFGGGGHARAILQASPEVGLVALDQDPEALPRAEAFKAEFAQRFTFYDINFENLGDLKEGSFQGILLDLGLSSFQLDEAARGFAFRLDGPTDMRLDPRRGQPASEFLEHASQHDLIHAIRVLGEESSWRRVVDAIVKARGSGELSNTKTFAELVVRAIGGPPGRRSRVHPATKTFQGVRMAVNDELGALERVLPLAFSKLAIGGVLVIISFHSLEDRPVKQFFRRMGGLPEHGRDNRPQDFRVRYAESLTKRPIIPSDKEILENPRCRSAKLRAIKKEKDYEKL